MSSSIFFRYLENPKNKNIQNKLCNNIGNTTTNSETRIISTDINVPINSSNTQINHNTTQNDHCKDSPNGDNDKKNSTQQIIVHKRPITNVKESQSACNNNDVEEGYAPTVNVVNILDQLSTQVQNDNLHLPEKELPSGCQNKKHVGDASHIFLKNLTVEDRDLIQNKLFVLAPMVKASELPFRLLTREYGANLMYTPMFYSNIFADSAMYRNDVLQRSPQDFPLIVQFSANNQIILANAISALEKMHTDNSWVSLHTQNKLDISNIFSSGSVPGVYAIDINFGCPLKEATRGKFGAELLQTPFGRNKVINMVRYVNERTHFPIFCKIRLLPNMEETVEFAKRLEEAGCALLTVHARQRLSSDDKRYGPAYLQFVKAIKEAVNIPVIANGNIRSFQDCIDNLRYTKADGVMSAEAILSNPALYYPTVSSTIARTELENNIELLKRLPPKRKSMNIDDCTPPEPIDTSVVSAEGEDNDEPHDDDSENSKSTNNTRCLDDSVETESRNLEIIKQKYYNFTVQIDPDAPIYNSEEESDKFNLKASITVDRIRLAQEYISHFHKHPVPVLWARYHLRHILNHKLIKYQLKDQLEDVKTIEELDFLLCMVRLRDDSGTYKFEHRLQKAFEENRVEIRERRNRQDYKIMKNHKKKLLKEYMQNKKMKQRQQECDESGNGDEKCNDNDGSKIVQFDLNGQ